jgi:hypothetical protein
MAKKTTLTVILPTGEKLTRTTARTYTHVVVGRSVRAYVEAQAEQGRGVFECWWEQNRRGEQAQYATAKDYADAKIAERIAAKDCKSLHDLTWCGRPDLATKEAVKWAKFAGVCDIQIVPVDAAPFVVQFSKEA